MSYWDRVEYVAGSGGLLPNLTGAFLALAFVLYLCGAAERARIRMAVLFYGLGLGGCLAAAGLLHSHLNVKEDILFLVVSGSSVFLIGAAVANVLSVLLFDILLATLKLHPPRIVRDLTLAMAYIVLAFYILSQHGANLTGLFATSAVMTAVVGFSLADTLGNIMGGLALQTERTICIGDWIRVDQTEGRVKEIRWRQTSIETRNWDTVVIPNSVLMRSQVTLLGRREGQPVQHRMWVYFQVDFRYSPTDVIERVQSALRSEPIPNTAIEPPPNCILMDFKESFASYAVRYWLTDLSVDDPTNSLVRQRIYFALKRANIPLSIPAAALFVTEDKEKRRERKQHEEIEHRVATLKKVELFHSLTEEELTQLAHHLRWAPFAKGEAMTRQGTEAHHLYILIRGEADVQLHGEGGLVQSVSKLKEGDFFGEMGLMTGAPRRSTTIAMTPVECYRVEKAAFDAILRQRPELAQDISTILARRTVELEAARGGLNEEARLRSMKEHQSDFLQRIKHFFTLE